MLKSKKNIHILFLTLTFIFAFKFFQSTPFEKLFFQLQAGFLGLVIFLLIYVSSVLLNRKRIDKVVLYYFMLIAIVPFYGAFMAGIEFGQPFIYGFLSEREWLLLGVGILFYYALTTKIISLATVESAFVFMAWASILLFSLIALTFEPSQLGNMEEVSNFVLLTEYRGLRFRFQSYFITFGCIYYFVKYYTNKNPKDLLFLLLFIAFVLFIIKGRTQIIFLTMTFLLYFFFNYSLSQMTAIFIKLAFFLLFTIVAIQMGMPEYFEIMGFLYSQMISVLLGQESWDYSANARINAALIVFDKFEMSPLSIIFGTGSLSNQWNEGYNSIYGYLHPSDIGILGGLFLYGVVGFIFLCLIPFIILAHTIIKVANEHDIFIVVLKYLLILALLRSIQGFFYFQFVTYVIPLFILLSHIKLQREQVYKSINT